MGFNRPFADSKGLCGANPKYLTTAEHGGIFLRYRLSETVITLLTINASTLERYQIIDSLLWVKRDQALREMELEHMNGEKCQKVQW